MRGAVRSSDMVRALLAEPALDLSGMPELDGQHSGQWLRSYAPDVVDWREFDHNAAVTALYAAYECCVTELLREWVSTVIPTRWPNYLADLPETTRRSYVVGIAKLLPKMGRTDRNRYRHLHLPDVARDFAHTTSGAQPYRLHPDAFLDLDQNLRPETLQSLFSSVGIPDVWAWVREHPLLVDYVTNQIGGADTLDNELNKFVQARNDAAHGTSGIYPGATELNQYSLLAEHLGTALVERARHDIFEHYLSVGRAESIGTVTEVLRRADAVIIKATGLRIVVGEPLVLLNDSGCDLQNPLSCRIADVEHTDVVPNLDVEVGLRFTQLPRKGTRLVRLSAPAPATAPQTDDVAAPGEQSGT
jgi:hypothetical protein